MGKSDSVAPDKIVLRFYVEIESGIVIYKGMFAGFEKIVEERIRKAQKEGAFDDLPGAGKPLPNDDMDIPEDIRLAYKVLKNADFIPPELELRKKIHSTQELLTGMPETGEKYKILKKLNLLVMKLNAMRDAHIQFDIPQQYMGPVTERLGTDLSSDDNTINAKKK